MGGAPPEPGAQEMAMTKEVAEVHGDKQRGDGDFGGDKMNGDDRRHQDQV